MSYLLGVTTVTSLWFFLHYSGSPIELFDALDQRLLQINYAKTLLPTIILGAIIPALTVSAYPQAESSKIKGYLARIAYFPCHPASPVCQLGTR
jgi:hypothetical protein